MKIFSYNIQDNILELIGPNSLFTDSTEDNYIRQVALESVHSGKPLNFVKGLWLLALDMFPAHPMASELKLIVQQNSTYPESGLCHAYGYYYKTVIEECRLNAVVIIQNKVSINY